MSWEPQHARSQALIVVRTVESETENNRPPRRKLESEEDSGDIR